ncbi:MAG: paraquat-inducible protein A [bacterium]
MKFLLNRWAINLSLLVALALLAVGLVAPILTLEQFYIFSDQISLASALQELWRQRDWGLVILLGSFSFVFPLIKLLFLFKIVNLEDQFSERHRRHVHWLSLYSKWSMLDVFVVALLVVAVKISVLVEAHVEYGIYAFAVSVILTTLISTAYANKTPVSDADSGPAN